MPKRAFLLDHLDFFVGKGGAGGRIPIDHPFAAVDQSLLIKIGEDPLHATRVIGIHREPFPGPIAGAAELLELLNDDAAVLFLPGPDVFEEFFSPDVLAMFELPLLAQHLFDLHLGGDARVVGAGQPKDFFALHSSFTGEDVLNRIIQDVAHMQDAGYVGGRDDNRISSLA